MQKKLPIKYEENIFCKIKRFFINIFNKNNIESKDSKQREDIEVKSKENEFEKMREISNKAKLKEDILTLIEKNPKIINDLPMERLINLESMYDEIIEDLDRKIKKLKRELA